MNNYIKNYFNENIFPIGLGMSKIGSKKFHSKKHIEDRLDVINYFSNYGKIFLDTAALYGGGFSESIIGDFIKNRRDKFFIATKFFPNEISNNEFMINEIMGSLKRLKTDHIDLLQVHWPNYFFDPAKLATFLRFLKERKVIKYLGVCNYLNKEINELNNELGNEVIFSNQIEFNLSTCKLINKNDISQNKYLNIAYSILNNGLFSTKEEQRIYLKYLANKYSCSSAAIILSWILSYKNILPLVKVSSIERAKDLLKGKEIILDNKELEILESFSEDPFIEIDSSIISLTDDKYRKSYKTIQEAYDNKLDLIPSPLSLSKRFQNEKNIIPIRVFKDKDNIYHIDKYDPIGQSKIYWSWKLAFPERKIPVIVINK